MIDTHVTLAEIASTQPGATRILHAAGLDYCCGGRRTLLAACAERGLDPAEVVAALREAEPISGDPSTWAQAPIDQLIRHIVDRYHQALRADLPHLLALAERVEESHRDHPSVPRGLAQLIGEVQEAVSLHLDKEERILFPALISGAGRAAIGPIHTITSEHDDHAVNLGRIRKAANDFIPPPEACTTWRALYRNLEYFEADLMEHIHLENNVLFPRALSN
jgi:regulator of cell morphogenesis and NO signaling